jgi:hypothetical protein
MLDISFKINGRTVNPRNIRADLEKAVLAEIGDSIKKSLRSVSCSTHNQQHKVVIKGRNLSNLSFEVSGCCEELIQKATSKLK